MQPSHEGILFQLQMTIRKYKENEKGQILDVITISSDDDQSSS